MTHLTVSELDKNRSVLKEQLVRLYAEIKSIKDTIGKIDAELIRRNPVKAGPENGGALQAKHHPFQKGKGEKKRS